MATHLYYATHNVSGFKEGAVLILDDADPEDAGLMASGYFAEIKEPERADSVPGPDRS